MALQFSRLYSENLRLGDPSRDAIAGVLLNNIVPLYERELEVFRRHYRIAQNITDSLPLDALGQGIKVTGNISPELKKVSEEVVRDTNPVDLLNHPNLNLGEYLKRAAISAETLGAAAIVLDVEDGENLEDPVALDKINKVGIIGYFNAYEVYPDWDQIGYWGGKIEPEFYRFAYADYTHNASQGRVHRSRVIPIHSRVLIGKDQTGSLTTNWLSDSSLRTPMPAIIRYDLAEMANTNRMIRNGAIIAKIKDLIKNLDRNASSNQGFNDTPNNNYKDKYIDRLNERAGNIAESINSLRVILFDKDKEELVYQESDFSNIQENLQQLRESIIIESNLPAFKVLGEFHKSLGSVNQGEKDEYALLVDSYRSGEIYKGIAKTLTYWMLSQNNPHTRGELPDEWSFHFPPVYAPTDAERAKTESQKAATLKRIQDASKVAAEVEQMGGMPAIKTEELRSRLQTGEYLGIDIPLEELEQTKIDSEPITPDSLWHKVSQGRDRAAFNRELIRKLKSGEDASLDIATAKLIDKRDWENCDKEQAQLIYGAIAVSSPRPR